MDVNVELIRNAFYFMIGGLGRRRCHISVLCAFRHESNEKKKNGNGAVQFSTMND